VKDEQTITEKIRSDIETRIVSGAWPPGLRIPFEHELMEEYGCSRMTASKAIGYLAQAGLVERRRRAGTFVAHHEFESFVLEIPQIQALVAQRGEAYAFEVLVHERRKASRDRPEETQLVGRGDLVEVKGIHHAGAKPLALEERYISFAAIPAAAEANFSVAPPGSWLLKHVPWSRAEQKITAVSANAREAALLKIASGAPCLVVERRTWRASTPVTYVRSVFPGDRYHLVGHFAPGSHRRVPVTRGKSKRSTTRAP
jgi:GntR family histidine utilization transcriptional repressor